ncbi:hypothetical protein ACSSS7_000210 [Eimeria intestinalis]
MAPRSAKRALALCVFASVVCAYPAFAVEENQLGSPSVQEDLVASDTYGSQQEGLMPAKPAGSNTTRLAALGLSVGSIVAALSAFLAMQFGRTPDLGDVEPVEAHARIIEALLGKTYSFRFTADGSKVKVHVPDVETLEAYITGLDPENHKKAASNLTASLKRKVDFPSLQEGTPTTVSLELPTGPVDVVFEKGGPKGPEKAGKKKGGKKKKH